MFVLCRAICYMYCPALFHIVLTSGYTIHNVLALISILECTENFDSRRQKAGDNVKPSQSYVGIIICSKVIWCIQQPHLSYNLISTVLLGAEPALPLSPLVRSCEYHIIIDTCGYLSRGSFRRPFCR